MNDLTSGYGPEDSAYLEALDRRDDEAFLAAIDEQYPEVGRTSRKRSERHDSIYENLPTVAGSETDEAFLARMDREYASAGVSLSGHRIPSTSRFAGRAQVASDFERRMRARIEAEKRYAASEAALATESGFTQRAVNRDEIRRVLSEEKLSDGRTKRTFNLAPHEVYLDADGTTVRDASGEVLEYRDSQIRIAPDRPKLVPRR